MSERISIRDKYESARRLSTTHDEPLSSENHESPEKESTLLKRGKQTAKVRGQQMSGLIKKKGK